MHPQNQHFSLFLYNVPTLSLKAKLRACCGKYRMTLAPLPRQKLHMPSCLNTLETHSRINEKSHQIETNFQFFRQIRFFFKKKKILPLTPEYFWFNFPCLSNSFWFCRSNFTLSIGAALVFEIAAAVPLRKKFSVKPNLVFCNDDFFLDMILDFYFKKTSKNSSNLIVLQL